MIRRVGNAKKKKTIKKIENNSFPPNQQQRPSSTKTGQIKNKSTLS